MHLVLSFFHPLSLEKKIILFNSCVRNNIHIGTGKNDLELLISSKRVNEDLTYVFEKDEDYEKYNIKIVLRLWEYSLPLESEFRGFVWGGNLNTIEQYSHILCFPKSIKESGWKKESTKCKIQWEN